MSIIGGVFGIVALGLLVLALVIKADGFMSDDHVRIFRHFRKSERAARIRRRDRELRVRAKRKRGRTLER